MISLQKFVESIRTGDAPPSGIDPLLVALWFERRGDWTRAHEIAQDLPGPDGSWVHAYLHRVEGDNGNARYWYRQAHKVPFSGSLEEEWNTLVEHLLGKG